MLMADDFDPVVSAFSNAGRVSFCDNGRMPSSYGGMPACASGRFLNGFLSIVREKWGSVIKE